MLNLEKTALPPSLSPFLPPSLLLLLTARKARSNFEQSSRGGREGGRLGGTSH